MRQLSISLLLVVVVSIIGAGWALDRIFLRLDAGDDITVQLAEQLGYRLVALLDVEGEAALADQHGPTGSAHVVYTIALGHIALPAVLSKQLEQGKVVTLESANGLLLHFLLPVSQRVLVIAIPEDEANNTMLRLMLTTAFYGAIILLVLVWLYPLIRRLQLLSVAARLIGEGDLSQRIDTSSRSQLYEIESEFNAMVQRIQTLVDDNRMLSSAVSHDLRTPLARLRFGIDALEETGLDARQTDYIQRISTDLSRMEQLVNVLLEFARLEQQLEESPRVPVFLRALLSQTLESHAHFINRRIELIDDLQEEPVILADERYTLMLLNNIVQNALKFSYSIVKISIVRDEKSVCLIVEDDGCGFKGEDVARLLKPFQKGEYELEAAALGRGFGLGLAVVERVAQWQGAQVHLANSRTLAGASVSVRFDRA